jgi:myo-inositol-1(or 4)-monophosphatase
MNHEGSETLHRELALACSLALAAGQSILRRREGDLQVGRKANDEVVTAADRDSDRLIRDGLAAAFPADALFSEETADSADRLAARRVWIIDPLDGTSDFVASGDEFSVSIGLAIDGQAALGVVYNPTRRELFAGGPGLGLTCNGIPAHVSRATDVAGARLSLSRKELAALAGLIACRELVPITSMAYKLARVAAGLEDGVLSRKRRKEWGSCAGAALVVAGGGRVSLLDGTALRFNRAESLQPLGMAASAPALHPLLLALLHPPRVA